MSPSSPRGNALLGAWAVGLLFLSLLPLGHAGTQEDPEITDPSGDSEDAFLGAIPTGSALDPFGIAAAGDVVAGWVEEDSLNLTFVAQVNGDLEGLIGGPGALGEGILADYNFRFSVTFNGLVKDLFVSVDVDGPHPDAGLTATVAGDQLRLTAPRDLLDAEAHGLELAFFIVVDCRTTGIGAPLEIITGIQRLLTDRAPDEGYGRNYTTQVALGGTPGDVDGDGLNDTFEMQYFGDLATANATGDNDGDGLNNSAEFDLGTDPTKFDTDGDSLGDGDDPFPFDGTRPADADGDGLNDSWERSFYQDIATYNGTDDPDRDNRTNLQEQADGTNPLKGDTDGDGVRDDLDFDPLDPDVTTDPDAAAEGTTGDTFAKPELYAGAGMFAAAATFCLLGLARFL